MTAFIPVVGTDRGFPAHGTELVYRSASSSEPTAPDGSVHAATRQTVIADRINFAEPGHLHDMISVFVEKPPVRAGIDPRNLLVDEDPSNNLKDVSGLP